MEIKEGIIAPISKKVSIQWLYVYFDSCLSFLDHAMKTVSKDRKAAVGLAILVKTIKEVESDIMQ